MMIFKSKLMAWWHISILKLSLLCLGIAIGAQWPVVFAPYILWLVVAGALLGLVVAFLWFQD